MTRRAVVLACLLVGCLVGCDGELRFAPDPVDDAASADASTGSDAAEDAAATDASGDGALETRQCASDPDCPFASQHCEIATGTCVECTRDDDCPLSKPRCDLASHRCIECGVAADCEDDETCDPATRKCVHRCDGAYACPSSTPTCAAGVCSCTSSSCLGFTEARICDAASGRCVECRTDGDCLELTERRCFESKCVHCSTAADCASGKRCDPVRHECVD